MLPAPDDPTVSAERARALIERTCPDLAPVRVERLGRGWDHDVHVANGEWVFRFPRNGAAAKAVETGLTLLPWLAPRLPVAIPVPTRRGVLDDETRWPFEGYRRLPGRTICDAGLDARGRAVLAPALGAFVRALHDVPLKDAPKVPGDELERLSIARRGLPTLERLSSWRRTGELPAEVIDRLARAFESCSDAPPPAPPTLVHADLHVRNLLVDKGRLSGVVDWVDVHAGHPSVDLAVAFEVLPASAREAFFREYGDVSADVLCRARWRAIAHLSAAAQGATQRGDHTFARASLTALVETSEG